MRRWQRQSQSKCWRRRLGEIGRCCFLRREGEGQPEQILEEEIGDGKIKNGGQTSC
jgi:hypothetical protein